MRILPENLDNLISCTALNVNSNLLVRLPRCIGRMPSLTTLSAFNNQITYIPDDVVSNLGLRAIRLSINQISVIPERVGNLKKLKELAIEHNRISVLPVSFHQLNRLKILRIEGNVHLTDPPPHILGGGAQAVVAYYKEKYTNDEQWRMRVIVSTLQNVLVQIHERGIADLSQYEPYTSLPGEADPWFALQMPYFWSTALPTLQKLWRRENLRGTTNPNWMTSYVYDERETNWALTRFFDSYGGVIKRQNSFFRRCSCVDAVTGQRKPCVPPRSGFLCFRPCTLIKMHLVFKRFKQERLWQAYKVNGIADAVKRAELEAHEFLDSLEGQHWLEETAFEKAEELLQEMGTTTVMLKKQRIVDRKKKAVIRRFDHLKKKVQRVRDKKAHVLREELNLCNEGIVAYTISRTHSPTNFQPLQMSKMQSRVI